MTTDRTTAQAPEVSRRLYELMVLMKAADDRLSKGISTGELNCVYWPSRGQEAIAAAMGVTLRVDDQLVTTYRGLHDLIGKGVPLVEIYGEMLGRQVGASRGKGGTMHIARPESGVMLSTGIVGAGLPVGVGLAMATQRKGLDRVTVVSFGDGATNTGSFHEAVNMAALWDLPMVLVCQNNQFAEMTPTEHTMKIERVADRAAGYGIPGVRVDGNDPFAVLDALGEAVDRARRGEGPTLVECLTFRFRGHYFGDPMAYIPEERMAEAQADDPIPRFRAHLLSDGVCTEQELDDIDAAAAATVDDAIATVLAAPMPSFDELDRDVYADQPGATTVPPAHGADEQEMTFREALNLALDQALAADDRVFLLGEDIADPGTFGTTRGLSTKYGTDRVLDTPISEAAIVGAAIGAAMEGYLPVAEIMIMDFIGIAVDQIVNHAAKLRFMSGGRTTAPITVRTQVYGGLGSGATHAQSLEGWFMHVPGLKVIVPATPRDAKGLMTAAVFDPDPCVVVETIRLQSQRGMVPTDPGFSIPLGQADVKRAGDDVTLVCYGRGVVEALGAADLLEQEGVSAEVLDLRTLVPLDVDAMVESVRRTTRAVVVHDAVQFAGPGAEIAAVIQRELFDELSAPVERVGARSVPNPASPMLEAQVYPNAESITAAVKRVLHWGTAKVADG